MRIWDLPPEKLCRKHLLGEHREIHALYSILLHNKKGYRSHPETLRWVNKLPALFKRHALLTIEMHRRGYQHHSPLEPTKTGEEEQKDLLHTIEQQEQILKDKNCDCFNG